MTITSVDLCCGAGGLSIGLELAGIKPLLMVDHDKDCISTLRHNGYSQAVLSDINELDYSDLKPTILTAGFLANLQ
jgi:DNA (cytosine-5)-methyltransferase 1